MLDADDRGHGHGRMADGGILQVNRTDPFTAGLDQILGAILDVQQAVRVDGGNIAGRETSIDLRRGIGFVVALDDPLASHHQFALRDAIAGQSGAVLIDDFDLDAKSGLAVFGAVGVACGGGRIHLSSAQTGQGDAFRLHQLVQTGAVQALPGQHQFGATDGRGIGNAPAIDGKHGHRRQNRVPGRYGQHSRQTAGGGIEHDGAVRIQRAFGMSGGARGITNGRGAAFIELRPVELFRVRSDAVLVAQDVVDAREHVGRIAQAYPGLDLGTARRDALDQWRKGAVEEQHAVFGVVDDVD